MATTNTEIDKAFLMILNELNLKDERIRNLERQVREMTLQLNSQERETQYNNTNTTNQEFQTISNLIISNQSSLPNYQHESHRINYNSDSDKRIKTHLMNPMTQTPSNSFISGIDRGQSRNDVKQFLAEVKKEIDPKTFKEFIKFIKMLTNKNIEVDKKEIFENVRLLLGEKHKILYKRFEDILGYKK